MSHSPEPWTTGSDQWGPEGIADANGKLIVRPEDCGTVENFERIVACVNACRAITTEQLLSKDYDV